MNQKVRDNDRHIDRQALLLSYLVAQIHANCIGLPCLYNTRDELWRWIRILIGIFYINLSQFFT